MPAEIQLRRSGGGLISAMLLWPRCRPTLGTRSGGGGGERSLILVPMLPWHGEVPRQAVRWLHCRDLVSSW